jgi:hypothetical protein
MKHEVEEDIAAPRPTKKPKKSVLYRDTYYRDTWYEEMNERLAELLQTLLTMLPTVLVEMIQDYTSSGLANESLNRRMQCGMRSECHVPVCEDVDESFDSHFDRFIRNEKWLSFNLYAKAPYSFYVNGVAQGSLEVYVDDLGERRIFNINAIVPSYEDGTNVIPDNQLALLSSAAIQMIARAEKIHNFEVYVNEWSKSTRAIRNLLGQHEAI